MTHETMEYDVLIVGAGPAGLAAAIRLKQQAQKQHQPIRVCVLEKAAQIGGHSLSGAVLEPSSLQTLLPDTWESAPFETPVTEDRLYYLTQKHALRLPTPKPMRNHGNYITSLGALCQFLAAEAEASGVEIYPGFAASKLLFHDNGSLIGVATGDLGVDKKGKHTPQFQPGMHLLARQTLFAEGCRGHLSQQLMQHFDLRADCAPQTYGLGIKEIWRISPEQHHLGRVIHTVGWPLDNKTYGGSFIYHTANHCVSLGFVIGLDYKNPWMSPFEEMQRFKTHPVIRKTLLGGERIAYGARALNEGGIQSIPKLIFPGGALIGDAAGFLNVAKIKGIHTAMQSGMLAAEACIETLCTPDSRKDHHILLTSYPQKMHASRIYRELHQIRNIRPGFRYGTIAGFINAAFETWVTRGHSPWTLSHYPDHSTLKVANSMPKIHYPKPDGVLTFDKPSSVYLTNTFHAENQPCHLELRDPARFQSVNLPLYDAPESRYCPAGVYQLVTINNQTQLQIDAPNCIHCKTCDIKDPTQNIVWKAPEGGGGPNYQGM